VEGIENMLRDPETVAALREQLPRLYEGAHTCRCQLWIIWPDEMPENAMQLLGMA